MNIPLSGKLHYLPNKKGFTVYYHFSDQFGARQRISLKFAVEHPEKNRKGDWIFPADAYAIAKQIDREVRDRRWNIPQKVEDPGVLLQDAYDQFIRLRSPNLAPATIKLHNLSFKKLKEYFGNIPVVAITQDKMIDFREAIIKQDRIENAAWWLRHLSAFFNYCADPDVRILERTPLTKKIKLNSPSKPIIIFSQKELNAIYRYLKKVYGIHAYNQLRFLELTGWRVGDSCILKRVHIDYERKIIRQFIRKGSRFRDYPMDTSLTGFMAGLPDLKEYVFHYRNLTTLDHYFRDALDKTVHDKLGKCSVHTLRKQFTYNCYHNGVPVEDCSRLLGHRDISTTLKYYHYWDTDSLRDSLQKSRNPVAKKRQKKYGQKLTILNTR